MTVLFSYKYANNNASFLSAKNSYKERTLLLLVNILVQSTFHTFYQNQKKRSGMMYLTVNERKTLTSTENRKYPVKYKSDKNGDRQTIVIPF